jgi:hypothetical protein
MKKTNALILAGILVTALLIGGAGVGAISWRIHESVQKYTGIAQTTHPNPGDDVASLMAFMNDDTQSMDDRNLIVWTLGRLSDSSALPALEGAYTGDTCSHYSSLCQDELEKAIKRCGGTPHPPLKKGH